MLARNHLLLSGTLTRIPELRYTPRGRAMLELNVAGTFPARGKDGVVHVPYYHRVTAWGGYAEHHAELAPGSAVLCVGRLDFATWQTGNQTRSRVHAVAQHLTRLPDPPANRLRHDPRDQPLLEDALNEALLLGRLTAAPDLRHTSAGVPYATLTVAVNERLGETEKVGFYRVKAWSELAEGVAPLTKGDPLLVRGRLVTDAWNDRDGARHYLTRIEATTLEPLHRDRPSAPAPAARGPDRTPDRTPEPGASEQPPLLGTPATRPRGRPARGFTPAPADARTRPTGTHATAPPTPAADEFPPEEDLPF